MYKVKQFKYIWNKIKTLYANFLKNNNKIKTDYYSNFLKKVSLQLCFKNSLIWTSSNLRREIVPKKMSQKRKGEIAKDGASVELGYMEINSLALTSVFHCMVHLTQSC